MYFTLDKTIFDKIYAPMLAGSVFHREYDKDPSKVLFKFAPQSISKHILKTLDRYNIKPEKVDEREPGTMQ